MWKQILIKLKGIYWRCHLNGISHTTYTSIPKHILLALTIMEFVWKKKKKITVKVADGWMQQVIIGGDRGRER